MVKRGYHRGRGRREGGGLKDKGVSISKALFSSDSYFALS